jgi:hypothetical protein
MMTAQHIVRSNFGDAYRMFTWYSPISLRNTRSRRRRDGPFLAAHFDHHKRDLMTPTIPEPSF